MLSRRTEIGLGRALTGYLAGLLAGVQLALYLFDRYDDGIADPLSGAIGLLMVAAGLLVVVTPFRGRTA